MLAVCRDVEMLTGQDPHNYTTNPEPGVTKVVFRDRVCLGYGAALAYAKELRADAYRAYTDANGGFDRDATETVSQWICNDGEYYEAARSVARSPETLRKVLTGVLRGSKPHSAPWHARRHISDYDMERVEWYSVARDLLAE